MWRFTCMDLEMILKTGTTRKNVSHTQYTGTAAHHYRWWDATLIAAKTRTVSHNVNIHVVCFLCEIVQHFEQYIPWERRTFHIPRNYIVFHRYDFFDGRWDFASNVTSRFPQTEHSNVFSLLCTRRICKDSSPSSLNNFPHVGQFNGFLSRDVYLELSDRSEIWQALRQQCISRSYFYTISYDGTRSEATRPPSYTDIVYITPLLYNTLWWYSLGSNTAISYPDIVYITLLSYNILWWYSLGSNTAIYYPEILSYYSYYTISYNGTR